MDGDIFISTDQMAASERSDFWRNAARPLFEISPFAGEEHIPLEGSFRARQITPLLGIQITFNNQIYHRGRHTIVQSGLDHYLVQIITSGTLEADCNGRDVRAGTGDIFIVDLARVYGVRARAGSRITFEVPRQTLEKAVRTQNLHGAVLKAKWPMTRLLGVYLQGLFTHGGELPHPQVLEVYDSTLSLLSTALNGDGQDATSEQAGMNAPLRLRALEFIRQNIDQPTLTPEHVARRLNVSRSHLYRAFAGDGGVAKVLRNQRLDAAFIELARSQSARGSISDLAYRLGFSSSNQLLRAFRARFGKTPGEVQAGAGHSDGTARDLTDLWSHCMDLKGKLPPSLR